MKMVRMPLTLPGMVRRAAAAVCGRDKALDGNTPDILRAAALLIDRDVVHLGTGRSWHSERGRANALDMDLVAILEVCEEAIALSSFDSNQKQYLWRGVLLRQQRC